MVENIEHIKQEIKGKSLVLRIPENCYPVTVCSWAVLGGGINKDVYYIVNHTVTPEEWIDDPREFALSVARKHDLPIDKSVVFLTAVSQSRLGYAREVYEDLSVEVFATAGLGNALSAGDEADHVSHYSAGTINIIAIVWGSLTGEAMLQSMCTITEAKSLYLFENGIKSTKSGRPATGTGTDCVAIASMGGDIQIPYAGKHGKFGEILAKATINAIHESLKKRMLVS